MLICPRPVGIVLYEQSFLLFIGCLGNLLGCHTVNSFILVCCLVFLTPSQNNPRAKTFVFLSFMVREGENERVNQLELFNSVGVMDMFALTPSQLPKAHLRTSTFCEVSGRGIYPLFINIFSLVKQIKCYQSLLTTCVDQH